MATNAYSLMMFGQIICDHFYKTVWRVFEITRLSLSPEQRDVRIIDEEKLLQNYTIQTGDIILYLVKFCINLWIVYHIISPFFVSKIINGKERFLS